MPLEIRELHIKATIVEKKNKTSVHADDSRREQDRLKKEITKDCINEILQMLEDKRER